MGNSLHIVYFIDMKNKISRNKENNVIYEKINNDTNINKCDISKNVFYTNNEIDNKYIEDNCLTDEQNLKKWLEYVECW